MKIASFIDHTLLKPEATPRDIENLCAEAERFGFAAVCVNPAFVSLARSRLEASAVKVATVAGFPLGASTSDVKAREAERAIRDGADEVDMVMALGFFKAKEYGEVAKDIRDVVRAAGGSAVKVILETGLLTPPEIEEACRLAADCGAAFVKTCTGFGPRGVTVEDVEIMKRATGSTCGIKASGGIRTAAFARELIEAGAARLGTSASLKIIEEENG